MFSDIFPSDLHELLVARKCVIIVDPREEGDYSNEPHILQSINVPLSTMELIIDDLIPTKDANVVVASRKASLDARAATRLLSMGYKQVSVLLGGIQAWDNLGYPLYTGFNTYSKAFGEYVEHCMHTPSIEADQLEAMLRRGERVVVVDSRTRSEHKLGTIPTSISMPGAELGLRLPQILDSDETLVVVNCAGRTRSIIGAQSLINLQLPNPVRALKNGTMGWKLAGHHIQEGSEAVMSEPTPESIKLGVERGNELLRRHSIPVVSWSGDLDRLRSNRKVPFYLFDVRSEEEYLAGHPSGAVHAPSGQLLQATDKYIASLASQIVLFDDCLVRAVLTASWLRQMGATQTSVLAHDDSSIPMQIGRPHQPAQTNLNHLAASLLSSQNLSNGLKKYVVIDLRKRRSYVSYHIPGSFWTVRSQLLESLGKISVRDRDLVLTGPIDLVVLALAEAKELWPRACYLLDGGIEAWVSFGLPVVSGEEHLLTDSQDEFIKPLEAKNQTESMSRYLSWEVGLTERIRRDKTVSFSVI